MSAYLSGVPKLQFFDTDGNPLVGGRLYTYAAGTTTPLATYTSASGATPNTNPIILDARGEANVWLASSNYKFVLKDADDVTIWTVDDITSSTVITQILAINGTAGAPPYTFGNDTDTGIFLPAVGQIGVTVGGVARMLLSTTAMTLGAPGGANDIDVLAYGDWTQNGSAHTPPVVVSFNATTMIVDCSLSNVFTTTFTANVTVAPTLSNPRDGQTINWFITQDGTGSRTMTWPTSFKWPVGANKILSTSANAADLAIATYRAATGFWYVTLLKGFA